MPTVLDVMGRIVRRGWTLPMVDLARSLPGYLRVDFRGAGLRSGFLAEVARHPGTAAQLAQRLGIEPGDEEGLAAWLDLGVTVGDLRRDAGRYSMRRRVKALVAPTNDAVAAFYEEFCDLDHRLVVEAPDRLRQGRPFRLADADAAVIARSSRLGEPYVQAALADVVPRHGRVRLLEVGCGSGTHMRAAADLNPTLVAEGIELQEAAAEQARRNLADWGLAGRTSVRVADIRELAGTGEHDLVTLHQNIYYFPEDHQAELLEHLRSFLTPGGRILVTSIARDAGTSAACLDLWGALTEGTARLPLPSTVTGALRAAGYEEVDCERVGPGGLYLAATGQNPGLVTRPR